VIDNSSSPIIKRNSYHQEYEKLNSQWETFYQKYQNFLSGSIVSNIDSFFKTHNTHFDDFVTFSSEISFSTTDGFTPETISLFNLQTYCQHQVLDSPHSPKASTSSNKLKMILGIGIPLGLLFLTSLCLIGWKKFKYFNFYSRKK
jgi:hypothetical protein